MKQAFLILSLLISAIYVSAQSSTMPVNESGKIEFTSIVLVDSSNAATLYSKSKLFIANTFVSAKDVTQLADEETKTVVVKGLIPIEIKSMGKYWPFGNVYAKITIQCKDGRYKYSITDLVHEHRTVKNDVSGGNLENEKPICGTLFMPKKQWEAVKECTNEKVKALIAKLTKEMVSTASTDKW